MSDLPYGPMEKVRVDPETAIAANRANWDDRAGVHAASRDYDLEGFVADPGRISTVVREDLPLLAPHLPGGSLEGLDAVHLQCHLGTDTLSLARLGARVTGVDLSPRSLEVARDLARRAGLPARFVECEVTRAAEVLGEQHADVVYTSVGAICWVADLAAWGRTVAALLRPGGVFYLRDAHPFLTPFDDSLPLREDGTGALVPRYRYFGDGWAHTYDEPVTYTDGHDGRIEHGRNYEWPHPVSEVVTVLLDAGLRLVHLGEHRSLPWQALPQMRRVGDAWELPADQRDQLPVAFSVAARRDRGPSAR